MRARVLLAVDHSRQMGGIKDREAKKKANHVYRCVCASITRASLGRRMHAKELKHSLRLQWVTGQLGDKNGSEAM